MIPGGSKAPDGTPFAALPATPVEHNYQYHDHVPVIVGHYWEQVPGHLWSPKVACVDYSVAKSGPLVAYRWSGETELDVDRYVYARGSSAEDTPGEGFGEHGEGYLRLALVENEQRIRQAARNLRRFFDTADERLHNIAPRAAQG